MNDGLKELQNCWNNVFEVFHKIYKPVKKTLWTMMYVDQISNSNFSKFEYFSVKPSQIFQTLTTNVGILKKVVKEDLHNNSKSWMGAIEISE